MRIKILFIALFFFVSLTMLGQIAKEVQKINVDSLQLVLPGLAGKEKIDILNRIAFAISRDHTDSSIRIAKRTIISSEKLDYKKGMADANMNLGISYLYLDSLKNSVNHYLNALRIYENTDTCWEMGCVFQELQGINFYTGRFAESKEYGRKAIKVFRHTSHYNYIVRTLMLLALTCTEKEEFDSAAYYNNLGLSILDSCPDPNLRSSIYFDQGYNIAILDSTYIPELAFESISWYLKALELSESLHDTDIIVLSLFNLGVSYWWIGTPEATKKGIEYTYKAKNIIEKIPTRIQLLIATYKRLATIAYYDGNYSKAIDLLKTGIAEGRSRMSAFRVKDYPDPMNVLLNKFYYLLEIQRSYGNLAEIYEELRDYKNAFKYYKLERQATEERFRQENKNLIAMLETDSENTRINNRIASFEKDRQISELKVSQSRNINIGAGMLLAILGFLGIILFRQNKLKNEHKSTLLEQKLLRLQMNPHFIFNSLANIQEYIWNKDPLTANEYLSSFSKLVRLTLENSRSDFVPVEKEVSTIENYLNLQKLRHKDKFVYTIHMDPEIDQENMRIPPMLVQPFIENSIEHGIMAKETQGHIDVKFVLEGDQINVEITDDGIGFKKSATLIRDKKKEYQSLAMSITQERLLAHYRKYKRKIQIKVSDLTDANNNVMGARVFFGIPYAEA